MFVNFDKMELSFHFQTVDYIQYRKHNAMLPAVLQSSLHIKHETQDLK